MRKFKRAEKTGAKRKNRKDSRGRVIIRVFLLDDEKRNTHTKAGNMTWSRTVPDARVSEVAALVDAAVFE